MLGTLLTLPPLPLPLVCLPRCPQVRFATTKRQFEKLVSKPTYYRSVRLDAGDAAGTHLVAVELWKERVVLDKPIFAGQAVLDISKQIMYAFHYVRVKPLLRERVQLLFTDTDSLAYAVRCSDLYAALAPLRDCLDLAAYPRPFPAWPSAAALVEPANKGVAGKFKDELPGADAEGRACLGVMKEFVGLKAKQYCFDRVLLAADGTVSEPSTTKRCKGVKKAAIRQSLTIDDYRKKTLTLADLVQGVGEAVRRDTMHVLRSRTHQITLDRVVKVSLSAFDDKRYLLPCGRHTYAYGHSALAGVDADLAEGVLCPWCDEGLELHAGIAEADAMMADA